MIDIFRRETQGRYRLRSKLQPPLYGSLEGFFSVQAEEKTRIEAVTCTCGVYNADRYGWVLFDFAVITCKGPMSTSLYDDGLRFLRKGLQSSVHFIPACHCTDLVAVRHEVIQKLKMLPQIRDVPLAIRIASRVERGAHACSLCLS